LSLPGSRFASAMNSRIESAARQVHDEHQRGRRDRGRRNELPDGIVAGILRGSGDGGERARDEQQRVSVGLRSRGLRAPIAPPAPVRLSTMIVASIACPSFCATNLATVSVPAPGGNARSGGSLSPGRRGLRLGGKAQQRGEHERRQLQESSHGVGRGLNPRHPS